MKYSELERKLRQIGCYYTGTNKSGHPQWYSPKTGKHFRLSHHHSVEVKPGTLRSIMKDAGLL